MENLYDSVLYDELPYDDTDSIDYNLKLPGYLYGQHLYGEELYGDPDDYNYAATAAGNSVSLAATHTATASSNTAALKAVNITKSVSGNTVFLGGVVVLTTSGNKVALRSVKTISVILNTAALKTLNRSASASGNTVYLKAINNTRSIGVTAYLQKLNNQLVIGATASLLSSIVSTTVRAKGNTVSLKGYTVLTEITQPVGVLVETQSPETSIIEFNMLGLGAVTSLEATNTFATSITEIETNFSITSIVEQGVRAHEALYDTQEYDVPMYDETEAVVLSEHVAATCGIEALNAAVATLTERDTWTLSSIVSGITFIDFMYGVMMYGEALYGETRTDIIDTSVTGTQSPTAIIGSV